MDATLNPREIGKRAAHMEGTRAVLAHELGALSDLIPFDLATVWLADDDLLVTQTQVPVPLASAGGTLPLSQWPEARDVLESGRSSIFQSTPAAFPRIHPAALEEAGTCVVAPLTLAGYRLGVLCVARGAAYPFDAAAVATVEVYGRLLAAAACAVVQSELLHQLQSPTEETVSSPTTEPPPSAPATEPPPSGEVDAVLTMAETQRRHIKRVLGLTGGRIYGDGGAAALLGMKPSTLQSRMKKLGIARKAWSPGTSGDYADSMVPSSRSMWMGH